MEEWLIQLTAFVGTVTGGRFSCRPGATAMGDEFAVLVIGAVNEGNDAGIGPRPAFPQLDHFRLDAHRIAMKEWLRKTDFVPAKIRDGGALCRVADRDAHHQPKREGAVDNAPPELRVLAAILFVEMQQSRVVGQRAEEDVVRFRHGARQTVAESLADRELVEIKSGIACPLDRSDNARRPSMIRDGRVSAAARDPTAPRAFDHRTIGHPPAESGRNASAAGTVEMSL